METAAKTYKNRKNKENPMTLSLKNTIPTLALLVAILMISGCGTLNSLADEAGQSIREFGNRLENSGPDSLPEDDECRNTNNLFNPTKCDEDYNLVRESYCINAFDAGLCGATLERVCVENINSLLCDRGIYRARRDRGLAIVNENDWRASFLDANRNVTERKDAPQPGVDENLFLGNLTSDEDQLARDYRRTFVVLGGFDLGDTEDDLARKIQQQRIFTIEGPDAVGILTLDDKNDGVSFVAGQYNLRSNCTGAECVQHRYYAGIHATTDLGKPLTTTSTVGTWKAMLRTVGLSYLTSMPFDLTITFDSETFGGTLKADFDVVDDGNTDNYDIDATFDEFGAITGDITVGGSEGAISGIIGQGGAVAAFISDETGVREASSPLGYAGGFVAISPNLAKTTGIPQSSDACVLDNSCVDYAHWVASVANPTDAPTPGRFLKGTATGLAGTIGGDTGEGAGSLADVRAGGDATDGFAIYRPFRTGEIHNVGILSTTRLGAPLPNTIAKAQWPGRLHERSGTDAITTSPITLTVDFSTGSGTGTITGRNGVNRDGLYEITASYSDIGVISGTIIRTASDAITGADTGQITGLIGAEGAVGVFRNHASSKVSFVGGFVALPPIIVNYAQWVVAASPTDTPTPNEFLKGVPNGLMGVARSDIGGFTSTLASASKHADTHILNAGDAGDGFAIYRPDRDDTIHNVGMFSTTSLGAPLSETVTNALWPGEFLDRAGTGLIISSNIILNVNFNAGTNTGRITGMNARRDYSIDARFNNFGVIRGTISYTTTIPGTNTLIGGAGPIRGLIGAEGAVGVFHSTATGTSFVGGFVAQPSQGRAADPCIAANTCVDYAHWEAAASPTDTPMPNQFLKGTPRGLAGVGDPLDIAHLDLEDNTDFYTGLSGGDAKDGFGIYRPFNPHSSGSPYNVGIYSTTNLGAPLRGTFTNALWAGFLQDRVGVPNRVGAIGITLTVGFNAGTSAGTITYGNTGTTYEIDADFDATGVISGEITRRAAGDTSAGVISGLIGVEGTVGVFRSNVGQTTSYVGGFVASPPAPNG